MKTAGIIIDGWKLEIFRQHLIAGGFSFTEHPGLMPSLKTLKVETDSIAALHGVIEAAQLECARVRPQ